MWRRWRCVLVCLLLFSDSLRECDDALQVGFFWYVLLVLKQGDRQSQGEEKNIIDPHTRTSANTQTLLKEDNRGRNKGRAGRVVMEGREKKKIKGGDERRGRGEKEESKTCVRACERAYRRAGLV